MKIDERAINCFLLYETFIMIVGNFDFFQPTGMKVILTGLDVSLQYFEGGADVESCPGISKPLLSSRRSMVEELIGRNDISSGD